MFATNPAMCAYAEAARIAPGEPVVLLSLGTGEMVEPIRHEDAADWGLVEWVRPVIDVVFDGVSDTVGYQLQHLLAAEDQLRMQLPLTRDVGLDDASPRTLALLADQARQLIERDGPALEALARRLTESG